MSASPIARQATQSQSIPSKRIVIHDPNQLPADYSSTPGGTLYSTTPGGQCIRLLRFISSRLDTFLNPARGSQAESTTPCDRACYRRYKLEVLLKY